jgi:hypothetical protein
VTPTEHTANPASTSKTGFFAVLGGLLRVKGSAARMPIFLAMMLFALLALSATPAFAVKQYVPGVSFGSAGSGAGQFTEPVGVAVNDSTNPIATAKEDVYVVDKGNNRIERFNSTGTSFEGQFNGSGKFEVKGKKETGTVAPSGQFSAPEGIAVDNSGKSALEDPSVEDVYVVDTGHDVVDKFSATGEYLGELKEIEGASGGIKGVAVDPSGNVWVYSSNGQAVEFNDEGVYVAGSSFNTGKSVNPGLAVDSLGQLYIITEAPVVRRITPPEPEGVTIDNANGVSGVATDQATGEVYVDHGNVVSRFGPSGEPLLEQFGSGHITDGAGLAVAQAGARVYVADPGASRVDSFNFLSFPTVTAPSAVEVSNTVETLSGTVEPEGEAVTECRFEYGLVKAEPGHYEHSVLCAQAPESITGVSANVSQTVSGLTPAATYHFRLDVSNENGTGNSPDATFTLFPVVGGESFSGVSSSSAVLHAAVEPGGVPTSYYFEYGPGVGYGFVTPVESAGAGVGGVSVLATVEGLSPGTTYHFRVVASSIDGTLRGADSVFSTFPVGLLGLPDGRGYELVSSLGNGDATVVPERGGRAAADGGTVTYAGQSPLAGGNGCGEYHNNGTSVGDSCGDNQYLASRAGSGWGAVDIQPEGIKSAVYHGFPSGLTVGFLTSEVPLVSGAPSETALYSRQSATGSIDLLAPGATYAASTPDGSHVLASSGGSLYEIAGATRGQVNVLPEGPEGGSAPHAEFGGPGPDLSNLISSDGSRVIWTDLESGPEKGRIFVREHALSGGGTVPVSEGEALFWTATADGRYVFYTELGNLYRFDVETEERALLSSDAPTAAGTANLSAATGTAHFPGEESTNILTNVDTTSGAFAVGQEIVLLVGGEPDRSDYSPGTVITAIGSSGELKLSKGVSDFGNEPLVISAGSREVTSLNTTTGHFLPGEELRGRGVPQGTKIEEVTPTALKLSVTVTVNATDVEVFTGGPRVVGVLGTSSDGSYVYFAAGAALAPGAGAQECAPATEAEEPNNHCNVYVLHDGEAPRLVAVVTAHDGEAGGGDWFPFVGSHSSFVSGDGRVLVFKSIEDLTGFDSLGDQEVYRYEYGVGLTCVSCNLSGVPTVHGEPYQFDAELPNSGKADFAPRDLSVSGGRVFFRTVEGLVPQDENGRQDVYEWERAGEGTCAVGGASYSASSGGCLFVLSGGTSTDESYFLDASENGDDAFIETRADLLPQDKGEVYELYDVRVGATPPPAEPQCTGAGCQGVPAAPPIFSTPASATITGVDGFPPAASKVIKKKTVKCVKGKTLKHGKCVKQKKSKKTKTKRASHDRRPSR